MFGVAWDRWLLLVVVALFVLGPDRLPAAAEWVGRSVRQLKSVVAGAQAKLNAELGPELAELRKPLADLPLAELRRLRNPQAAVAEFLFADGSPPAQAATSRATGPLGSPSSTSERPGARLVAGERPPTDPDAT